MNDRDDVRGSAVRGRTGRCRTGAGRRARSPLGAGVSAAGGLLLFSGLLAADDTVGKGTSGDDAAAPSEEVADPGPSRGGMIPRDALVDMTRAQSSLLCASETFLGCMGFDGTMCRSLSESAIEQCLLTLPAEIDPRTLDNATLESCPRIVYEKAGYREDEATACLQRALDDS